MPKNLRSLKNRLFKGFRLRKRVKEIRGKPGPKTLNESRARELVARKVVLPLLKKAFGEDLAVVLITGSAQEGVRRAVSCSDLDVAFFVHGPSVGEGKIAALSSHVEKAVSKFGFNCHFLYRPVEQLESVEPGDTASQVIFGKAKMMRAFEAR